MKSVYPAYLKKGFQPYAPIELMRLTEDKACRGETRKYTDFYCVGVYGGISTGYMGRCFSALSSARYLHPPQVRCGSRRQLSCGDHDRSPLDTGRGAADLVRHLCEMGYKGYFEEGANSQRTNANFLGLALSQEVASADLDGFLTSP